MAEASPRIVIVGGVAGGASAAARARRANESAEIVLLERDAHMSFANCGLPYYIGGEIAERDKLLVTSAAQLRDRFRIDARPHQEVLAVDRPRKSVRVRDRTTGETYEEAYDKLILSPGAEPIVPPVPGADAEGVFTLRNLEDTDRIDGFLRERAPARAVVVGAGYIGIEMAEQLARRGLAISVVEKIDRVLPMLDPEMSRPLESALRVNGVELALGDGVAAIEAEGGGARAVRLESGRRFEADLVLLGIGVRPSTDLADAAGLERGAAGGIATDAWMRTSDPEIYAVGDAAEYPYGPTGDRRRVALAGPANRAGRLAGEHAAAGRAAPMRAVQGTAIVRAFDAVAALTGLTEEQARRAGFDARSVTVRHPHHAGYYPGAKPLLVKLVYDPESGRLLGAQATGEAGVDKRIDVAATALAFNATVRDLAGLDLAYAPPFGAAKDPIHMAAFAACNDLDGLVAFTPADADLAGKQVVDVRSAAEVEAAPLPGCDPVHIPLEALRDRIDELDPQKETVVSCASGVRAYLAARLLRQRGFDRVSDLTGGATLRRLVYPGS